MPRDHEVLALSVRIRMKRVYEAPGDEDGFRVLVDRLWPRGLRKEAARLDAWAKDLAPSSELRRWFAHDPAKFIEFTARYRRELAGHRGAIEQLLSAATDDTLTLLYAAKDPVHNHAVVLRAYLDECA